jgi:hypothetical protein
MQNSSKKSGLSGRLIATAVIAVLWFIARKIYLAVSGPLEAEYAVNQVKDSASGYIAAQSVANGLVGSLLNWGTLIALAIVWLTFLLKKKLTEKVAPVAGPLAAVAFLVLLGFGSGGCMGPARVEQFVEIAPNETAYVVPLEGASGAGQAKFDSVEFLEKKKVAVKRISLGLREKSTGRAWWDYEWIPTDRVIKVDRAPVTREWTTNAHTGTSTQDQSLHMQSLDSISFHIGATITVNIVEDDASKFLYNYGGKQLHDVVDTNIRSYILGQLTTAFTSVSLEEGMKKKAEFFKKAGDDATKYFKGRGITIDYFGIEGGLGYDNPLVQGSIDKKFIAENDKQVADNEQAAQAVRNKTAVDKADADARAAAKFAAAKDALKAQMDAQAVLLRAEATKIAAQKWDGSLPKGIVPQGSSILFDMDRSAGK